MERKKILIVDDDADLTRIMDVMLTKYGFEVKEANSRVEGMQKLKQFKPDLVILDVNMETEHAGFDMNKELRTDPLFNEIPILLLTGIDVVTTSNQVVDMYRSMRGTPGFDEKKVLKVTSVDGSVAVDYHSDDDNRTYWLPLDGFLSKPVEEDELLGKINNMLKR